MGAPIRALLIGGIHLYRITLSGWLGGGCRFYPTCSHYAEAAVRNHGALKGSALATWRVLRCNPYGAGGVDHVPTDSQSDERMTPSYRNPVDGSNKVHT
ncbi:MAG TPA: membrane protein insertion efficiency factor YidD [Actinomycetota bacterium]